MGNCTSKSTPAREIIQLTKYMDPEEHILCFEKTPEYEHSDHMLIGPSMIYTYGLGYCRDGLEHINFVFSGEEPGVLNDIMIAFKEKYPEIDYYWRGHVLIFPGGQTTTFKIFRAIFFT